MVAPAQLVLGTRRTLRAHSVCNLLLTGVSPAKTDEPIEMAFGLWTSSDPKNRVLAGRQDPPWQGALLGSGVTSHRQPRQCQGPKTLI